MKPAACDRKPPIRRSEEHTSELQSRRDLVCRLLLEKKNGDVARLHIAAGERDGGGEGGLVAALRGDQSKMGVLEGEAVDFFFNDPPTTEISTLSLHDALPI